MRTGLLFEAARRHSRGRVAPPSHPDRTPLSPRATANDNGAMTRATSPSCSGGDTGSPSRQQVRSAKECARLTATTPRKKTGKRAPVNSGARVRGSGGGSGRKRVRSRARISVGTKQSQSRLQTQVEERLATADLDKEHGEQLAKAEEESRRRRKRLPDEACAEARQNAPGPASGLRRQSLGGKSRQVGSTETQGRAMPCRKPVCGWVTTTPGHQCNKCPEGVTHWAEDRLCTACHRPPSERGFVHLHVKRIDSARSLLADLPSGEAGVVAMLRQFNPQPGGCLCQRDGCLMARLGRHEKNKATHTCQGPGDNMPCSVSGVKKKQGRWYSVSGDEEGGRVRVSAGGGGMVCQACNQRRARERKKSLSVRQPGDGGSGVAGASSSSQAPAIGRADVVGSSTQRTRTGKGASTDEGSGIATGRALGRHVKAASIVRSRVEGSVKGGEILFWKDVAKWLTAERAKLGEERLQGGSVREKVKQMFDSIGRSSDCNARVVDIRGSRGAGGDGREKALCLFPKDLSDEAVVGYLLRMRKAEGATLKSELERVAQDPADPHDPVFEEERMAVVKTAGEIVRRDIELEKSLHNARPPGQSNINVEELERPVERTADTLLAMPPTTLGFFQSVTDVDLNVEQNPADPPKDAGPCKVWERGWREEFEKGIGVMDRPSPATAGSMGETTVGSAGGAGSGDVGAISGGVPVLPASETRARAVDKFNRCCRSIRRRLTVMCTSVVKSVLGSRYMPSHAIKATQWAKSKNTPRPVLNFIAEHLGCATDSQVYHRESKFARVVEDSNLLAKCAKCAAFSQDNVDFEPRVGVRQGEGPYIPCVACVANWVGEEVGTLHDAGTLKRLSELSVDDILVGSDAAEGERRYGAFLATLFGAVSKSERIRSAEGGPLWCFEAQLREAA
ncbi:unnamed protein product [Ectocarpus sp. CCAP 1310/34]|nr:unnamed protein product [Ectocarpus sp. CCAP 1310/34]